MIYGMVLIKRFIVVFMLSVSFICNPIGYFIEYLLLQVNSKSK